jgi:transposase
MIECMTYLLNEPIIHADETVMQVLDEVGKKSTSKSYMWLYATGMYSNPIFLYEYQPSRAKEASKRILKRIQWIFTNRWIFRI